MEKFGETINKSRAQRQGQSLNMENMSNVPTNPMDADRTKKQGGWVMGARR